MLPLSAAVATRSEKTGEIPVLPWSKLTPAEKIIILTNRIAEIKAQAELAQEIAKQRVEELEDLRTRIQQG